MAIDHSLTYRKFSIKNIPHRIRLSGILARLRRTIRANSVYSYLDVGCSNGYLTNIIAHEFSFKEVMGVDHNTENLVIAKDRYPLINFKFVDLNIPQEISCQEFDLVTCFETMEHVGNLDQALKNVVAASSDSGLVIISVPIETGVVGMVKFLLKTLVYNYKLTELPSRPSWLNYFSALFKGDISKFRDKRPGWGTHFGFDYKGIDSILNDLGLPYKAENSFATRFYFIKKTKDK